MGIISYIKEEIEVIRERDPAIKSNMEVFLYPTFHAILRYRFAHRLYRNGHYFWARWISQRVTLGGTGKEQGKRHPTLEDNVMVSAGAKVLGSFTIGENSKIGAGSVVLGPVPPNCTVVGIPGRIVKKDSIRIPRNDLDQVNLPDPVLDAISELQNENRELKKELRELKEQIEKL